MTSSPRRFDLQAHRGGAGLWPENTLEAFGRALALGVSTLELDVHLTADDDVVVAHDPMVADARRILREGTSADRQIAAFEVTRGGDTSNRQALDAVVDWLAETTRDG